MLRSTVAAIFGLSLALPLLLPISGFEAVPPMAQAATLTSLLFLAAQFGADIARPRRGGSLRLVVYGFVVTAMVSFAAGCLYYGPNTSAAISFLNWVALGSLVIAGQVLLTSASSLDRMLDVFVGAYTVLSLGIILYLVARFGMQIFSSTNRGPFQVAVRVFMTPWPNYYGVAVAVAITVLYGRLLVGGRQPTTLPQLLVLSFVLLMTFSRGALLACLAGMLVTTVVVGRFRRAIPIFIGSMVIAGALASLLPGVRYQFVASFTPGSTQNVGVLERLAFAAEALRLWSAHPLVGIGFHQFVELADPSRVARLGGTGAPLGSVHNDYITTLLKGGLLVMTLFLVLLITAIRVFRDGASSADNEVRRLGITGLGMLAVLVVAGLTLESFRTVLLSGPFWALVGGVDALRVRQLLASPSPASSRRSRLLVAPSPSR